MQTISTYPEPSLFTQVYQRAGKFCNRVRMHFDETIATVAFARLKGAQDWHKPLCSILDSYTFYPLQARLKQFVAQHKNEFSTLLDVITHHYIENGSDEFLSNALSLFNEEDLGKWSPEQIQQMRKGYHTLYGTPPVAQGYMQRIWRFLTKMLDTWLAALRFFNGDQHPAGSWEAAQILAAYATLVATPLQLISVIVPHVSSISVACLIVAGIGAVLALSLEVYSKYLQPPPVHLDYCTNLTEMAKRGELEKTKPRFKLVNELRHKLEAANSGSIPVLCGPSGAGKTEIVKAFAREAASDDSSGEWKKWKDATVYLLNTAELLAGGLLTSSDKLKLLKNRIASRHKGKVIIALDEHQAAAEKALQCLLRTEIDFGSIRFIGSMLPEDYEKMQEPDKRRLSRLDVPAASEKATLRILQWRAQQQAPELEIGEKELQSVYTKSKRLGQPAAAVDALSEYIGSKKAEFFHTSGEIELAKLKQQREALRLEDYRAIGTPQRVEIQRKLEELDEGIGKLEKEGEIERQKRQRLGKLKVLKAAQKKVLYQIALPESPLKEYQRKRFLFVEQKLLPELEKQIQKLAAEINGSLS